MADITNRTLVQQDTQIRNSRSYNDDLVGTDALQTNAQTLQDDLNSVRTQLKRIIGESDWYSQPANSLSSLNAGGITTASHKALDTLVHNIAETSFLQITRTNGRATNITIWASPAMTLKIRDFIITRVNNKVSSIITNQYDSLGVVVESLSQVIARAGNQTVTSITSTGT